ncbi:MAG: calcium-binding protein [Pseudomonadota bacterium]
MANIQGTTDGEFIRGTGAKDTIVAGGGDDVVSAGGGNDSVNAGYGDDLVRGGNGNDIIDGGQGDDIVRGDAGDDTLNGGEGNDILTGGWGADTFVWGAFNFGGSVDVVTDFRLDQGDLLNLKNATVTAYEFKDFDGDGDPNFLKDAITKEDVLVTITDNTSGEESTIWLLDVVIGGQSEQDVIDYLDSLSGA